MNKLKLLGKTNIPIDEKENIEANKDYFIGVIAQRESVEQPDPQGEETEPIIYKMRISHYEVIKEVGETENIEFQKGYTPSQVLRFAIMDMLQRAGKDDNEKNYQAQMSKIIDKVNEMYQ